VTFQGQDFQAQEIIAPCSGSTPPGSVEASALIQEQDVILRSYQHLKGNYYLSPRIDTVRGPSRKHDRLSLTKSEQVLSLYEKEEDTLMSETDVSDLVLDSMRAISERHNLQLIWTKLPINPKHYDTSVTTIKVSKGRTEHNNGADSLLLIDALETEFKISCIPDPWVVVSEEDT
jgi:hypothetical protein